jgi:hypothetical protein
MTTNRAGSAAAIVDTVPALGRATAPMTVIANDGVVGEKRKRREEGGALGALQSTTTSTTAIGNP